MIVEAMQYGGYLFASIGLYLLSSGRTIPGNINTSLGSTILVVYGIVTAQWGMAVANIGYMIVAIVNLYRRK